MFSGASYVVSIILVKKAAVFSKDIPADDAIAYFQ